MAGDVEKRLDRFHAAGLRRVTVMAAGGVSAWTGAWTGTRGTPSAVCALLPLFYPAANGGPQYIYEDYRQILPSNPCPG
jgi:hypothetical protein